MYGSTSLLHNAVDIGATVSNDEKVMLSGNVQQHAYSERLLTITIVSLLQHSDVEVTINDKYDK